MKANESGKDPVFSMTSKGMKNDLLIFKDEALKDFKEAQKKITDKYKKLDFEIREKLDSYERRINVYESKIMELSKMINTDKTIRERVDKLIEFKEKVDDSMLTEKIRLDNTRNDLNHNVNRIDQILKDSVIYPGIIGGISRYKTFHEFIDYVLTQCSQNLTFREKSIIDFKNYKEKLDNTISSFNSQINKLLNTTSEYTKTCVKECEDRMKSIYNVYDDRLQDARIENANYAIGLEKATESLKKELENLYIVKNELYKKVDNGIIEMKNDNTRVTRLFIGYKKGFTLLQHKFTQLSEFIKDIRFRINLKEDVKRREFAHMSDMINFDKRKKGFMDGVYDNNNYLKKGLESQLKDYISGKIKADEIFKKRDTSKNINKIQIKQINNSINVNDSLRRKSLSQSVNKLNSLSEFNDDMKSTPKNIIRGSISFQNRKSLENIFSKIEDPEKTKKDIIKEEEEDENNSSKDIMNYKKVLIRKNTQVIKLKKDINKVLSEKNNIEKINEDKKELSEDRKKRIKNEDSKIQIISKDKDISDNNSLKEIKKLSQPRTSLKNVINDIFNVKNIIDNIKKNPNSNNTINQEKINLNIKTKNIKDFSINLENKTVNDKENNKDNYKEDNKKIYINQNNDKKINVEKDKKKNNNDNNNNNENNKNNDNRNIENKKNENKNNENKNNENKNNENKNNYKNKNEKTNFENNIKIGNNNNIENKSQNNKLIKSSTELDLKYKTLNEHKLNSLNINNNKNIELSDKKDIKYSANSKEKEKENNNNRIIESSIKKKLLNPELNKLLYNGKTLNNITNNKLSNDKKKSNSTQKNSHKNTQKNNNLIFKSNQKSNTNYKSFNILRRDDNLIVTNYIPGNDINIDELNYLKFKKKNNI